MRRARALLVVLVTALAVSVSGPGVAVADTAAPAVPDAPASVTAKSAYAGAGMTVRWPTPADGNSPITGYTVTTNPGGATTTLTADEVATPYSRNETTIPGLVIGRSYTFSVAATNAVGTGPESTSSAVAFGLEPDSPGSVAVTSPGPGRVDVSWTVPADNGAPLDQYTVNLWSQQPAGMDGWGYLYEFPSPAGAAEGDTITKSLTHVGNGRTYRAYLSVSNNAGESPVTSSDEVTVRGAPYSPRGVSAVTGNGTVDVNWGAPSDGGSPVTGYTVTLTPPGGAPARTRTVAPDATSASFTGLTNGTSYGVSVVASNAFGNGTAATTTATPTSVPGPVTGVSATRGDQQATVRWAAPSNDGGSAVTGYRVTASPGGVTRTVAATARSMVFTGLTNGTNYTFKVLATNAKGAGPASAASAAVVPAGAPAKTPKPTASAGNGLATVSWKAPASNGSAITTFEIRCSNGVTRTVSGSVRSMKFTGLTKGKRLSFQVRAVTSAGTGLYSLASAVVTIK